MRILFKIELVHINGVELLVNNEDVLVAEGVVIDLRILFFINGECFESEDSFIDVKFLYVDRVSLVFQCVSDEIIEVTVA